MATFTGPLRTSLERLARRHFWIIIVNLLSVSAFLHARGVDALVALRLSPDAAHLAGQVPASQGVFRPELRPREDRSAAAILARNAFDSVTGPLREHANETFSPGPLSRELGNPMDAPECEGVRVVAIAASADPDWSLASFVPSEAASPVLRRRGGAFAGKTVSFIGWDRVWLVDKKGLCQAPMGKPPGPVVTAPGVGEKPSPRSPLMKELAAGIRRLDPTSFSIDRSVVEKILEHQAVVASGSQIVPDEVNGHGGFRVSGVKADSLLSLLGIQNGDHMETINGFDMSNPEKALEAYARLRQATHLTLTVSRNGSPTNIDYDIQP